MTRSILWKVAGTIILMATVISADILTLKDGRVLTGTYKSGTTSVIMFEVDGYVNTYTVESINTLSFKRTPPPPPVSPKPATTTPPTATGSVTINPGTTLMVRNESRLITGKVKQGDRFTARLEGNLVVNGQVIAKNGSTLYGRVVVSKAGKKIGRVAKLVLELTNISIGGQLYPVITDQIKYDGERSGALKKIAAGAAVGAAMDKKKGARTGAKIGVAAAVLTPGNQISIPVRSLLSFQVTQPLQVKR